MNPLRPTVMQALPVLTLLIAFTALPSEATITGVCPDGSMFIVRKSRDIPCPDARRVDPHDMPPIRPHYLPRPYAWERHQQRQDPNNPYNLLEPGDSTRAPQQHPGDEPQRLGGRRRPTPPRGSAQPTPLPPVAAGPSAGEPLVLTADETRDLGLIVELGQERIPARIVRGEPPTLTLDLVHSRAFDAHLRNWFAGDSLGPVVLFQATSLGPEEFYAHLTFVQGHNAFSPEQRDPRSFGLLDGELGAQPAGGVVLGYAVLPESMDLAEPIDIYWNDRRISVVLMP